MIFKTAYKKGNKYLVKIVGLEKGNDDGTWATCSEAVYKWAKKNYSDGDEVGVQYSEKNGSFFVSKITSDKAVSKKEEEKEETPEFVCEECGKALKDGKYSKCYECNQKAKKEAPKSSGSNGRPDYTKGAPYGSVLPVEADRRNKLACLSSACDAVQVLQGHVADVEAIGEAVLELYKKFYKEVSK